MVPSTVRQGEYTKQHYWQLTTPQRTRSGKNQFGHPGPWAGRPGVQGFRGVRQAPSGQGVIRPRYPTPLSAGGGRWPAFPRGLRRCPGAGDDDDCFSPRAAVGDGSQVSPWHLPLAVSQVCPRHLPILGARHGAYHSLGARPGLSMALATRWEPGMSMAHGTYHSVVARSVHGTDPTSPPPALLSLESFATVSLSSGSLRNIFVDPAAGY